MFSAIKSLVAYTVKYPIVANILIAATLVGGLVALVGTKKSFFPTRADKNITISVTYPGASPEEMEEGVTQLIEEAIYSLPGIDDIISTSSENAASITVVTLENYNIDEIYTEIKNSVDGISSFPAGAEKPVIFKQRQRSTAQWLALVGDVDLKTMKRYAKEVEEDMLAAGVVSQVSISGFNETELSIEVTEDDLNRYNLTFDQVVAAVSANNRDISAGSIKGDREEILIRSKAKQTDAEEIGEIILRSNTDGTALRIRDVATVREQFADQPNKTFINGQRTVVIEVRKLEEEDLQEISAYVAGYVKEFNETHSAVQLESTWDFMSLLTQRLDLLTSNGVVGLSLVLVALGLFLSLRLSFWVAWGIPSSFLGMFILGTAVGLTINMISLFGMILVIGILVDDGIVIAENIYSHFERTGNPVKAAINGTMEVLPAVFTSVTTTIVAFMPLLFLTGGFEFLKDMAYVVMFSLGFSLLEAFFVLPAHLASKKVLRVKKEDTRSYKIRKALNNGIDFFRYKLYGNTLKYTMEYRWVSFIFLFCLFIITGGLFSAGAIKSTFFPQIPFNSVNINVAFKPGEAEAQTERYIREFDDLVWEMNDEMKTEFDMEEDPINYTFAAIGSTSDGSAAGSHAGNINVFYRELDEYEINQFDIIERLRKKIGLVPEADKFSIGGQQRFGKPVSLRLIGKDNLELRAAKDFLKRELENLNELKEIQDDEAVGNREMLFNLNPRAYFLGLNHNDITKQVRQGFFGEEAQRFMKGDDEVKVWVRYPKSDRITMGQLEKTKVKTSNGEAFPLNQLASYEIERGFSGIRHFDTNKTVTVEAEMVDPFGEVPPVIKRVEEEIVPKVLAEFPEVKVDFGGQAEESNRAQGEIGLFFGGAFVIIFVLIMLTFRSFYQALMVIMMIPLGWLGAMWGHGLEGFPVSILSAWGMIALSGVIINDAVVFLAKFNSFIKDDGMTVYQAAYHTGLARFRAIMLTSITTVVGLYPLIKETSFQAQFLIPMGISVAYGVLIGTIIILLFFPVIILVFNDVRRFAKWMWTGQQPIKEDVERVLIDQNRDAEFEEAA